MVTALKQAIDDLRHWREVFKDKEPEEFFKKKMKQLEEDICLYRSDEKITVFAVEGLDEFETIYKDLDAIDWRMSDVEAGSLLDDGIPIIIKLERMTGRAFGQLLANDD